MGFVTKMSIVFGNAAQPCSMAWVFNYVVGFLFAATVVLGCGNSVPVILVAVFIVIFSILQS